MDVSEYDQDDLFRFVEGGRKFYYMTRVLGLDYLWYDRERQKIEIWGPVLCSPKRPIETFDSCRN